METLVVEAFQVAMVRTKDRIVEGDSGKVICWVAERLKPAAGVMGTRRRTLFKSLHCEDELQAVIVKSQLQQIARPMYSNPPVHGALIVSTILGDSDLKNLWLKDVKENNGGCFIFLSNFYLFNKSKKARRSRSDGAGCRLPILNNNYYIDLLCEVCAISPSIYYGANGLPYKKKCQRAASKDLELHQTVNAIVEIVKENYMVLSIPKYNYVI